MLTARTAISIARNYGFDVKAGKWEKGLVLDSIIQARDVGARTRTDGRSKTAEAYFDCYMSQYAHDFMVEGLAAREFERAAY